MTKPAAEPIHKFNGGKGATLCNTCSIIITEGCTKDLYCAAHQPIDLEAIRERLKSRPEGGWESACGEYNCPCHYEEPALLAEVDRLNSARADLAKKMIEAAGVCNCGSGPEFRAVNMRHHAYNCATTLALLLRAVARDAGIEID